MYDSDLWSIRNYLEQIATTTELLALQEDQFKVAFLRPVMKKALPNNGGGPME